MNGFCKRLMLALCIGSVFAAQAYGQAMNEVSDTAQSLTSTATNEAQISLKLRPISMNDPSRKKLWARLFDISAPVTLKIEAGEQVDNAVKRKCGNSNSDLIAFIAALNKDAGGKVENYEREWRAFPCPYWAFGSTAKPITIPVSKSQTLANILPFHMGEVGPMTVESVKKLNPGVISPSGMIKEDIELKLPYVVKSTTINLNEALATKPSVAIAAVTASLASPGKDAVFQASAPTAGIKYRLVAEDFPVAAVSNTNCAGPADAETWPFDLAKALQILAEDKTALKVSRPESVVLVADTGFDPSLLKSSLLWINRRVKNMTGSVTEYVGDLNGANLVDDDANISPSKGYEFWRHGTDVFGILAGGKVDDAKLATYLAIAAAKIDKTSAPYGIDRAALHASFGYAVQISRQNPTVVLNLSSVSTGQILTLAQALRSIESLVVVAAGNNSAPVDSLDIYPPAFSDYRERMIVVGAHDWHGKVADFSNRGALVDLLAPGCKLNITDALGVTRSISGTSFAAPFVSVAAALLSSLDLKVWEVKNRILSSVDYDATLTHVVHTSGRLNLSNALRVRTDILQVRDTETHEIKTLYGTVDATRTWYCGTESGATVPYRPGRIAKLIGEYHGPKGNSVRIISKPTTAGNLVYQPPCEKFSGPLMFEEDGTGLIGPIQWANVVGIIFRTIE